MKQAYQIAVMARLGWNLHSMNNEGSVGNVTMGRKVTLPRSTARGIETFETDMVSGEMLKHGFVESLWTRFGAEHLCPDCKTLRPVRASKAASHKDALACPICDLSGYMSVVKGGLNLKRYAPVEFGMSVALPEAVAIQKHIHARHGRDTDETEAGTAKATDQMIYYRPTRSGQYAFHALMNSWKIGVDDTTFETVLEKDIRWSRFSTALYALADVMIFPQGAMRATRLAHVTEAQGIIVVAGTNSFVPRWSPLDDRYREMVEGMLSHVDEVDEDGGVHAFRFDSPVELLSAIKTIMTGYEPWSAGA